MNQRFHQKSTLITGASSGIGEEVAIRLAQEGSSLFLVGRNETSLLALKTKIKQWTSQVEYHCLDLKDISNIAPMVQKAFDTWGRLDHLVHCAGIIDFSSIETTSLEQWNEMNLINTTVPFLLMQACIPFLEKTKGSIVNVSSVTGLRAFPGVLPYCVSKAALDQLTRCVALEVASKGIRVNAVNPGVVVSQLHRRAGMNDVSYAEFLEKSKTTHPLGRVGQPEEIASLIAFLASEEAGWITGETIAIDGGRAQTCAR